MSYPPRPVPHIRSSGVWLDKGHEITHADTLKASPPPDWTDTDESAHGRYWSRRHVSNPSNEQRVQAWLDKARREARALPTAAYWREVFGC
jgi:hypothetical protein